MEWRRLALVALKKPLSVAVSPSFTGHLQQNDLLVFEISEEVLRVAHVHDGVSWFALQ